MLLTDLLERRKTEREEEMHIETQVRKMQMVLELAHSRITLLEREVDELKQAQRASMEREIVLWEFVSENTKAHEDSVHQLASVEKAMVECLKRCDKMWKKELTSVTPARLSSGAE